ncbi:MAG: ketoacyl-ACP synthase III [Phycisphaerales bacterium]|nr:ketoacyl-ACP synthase III [Phycisphaerales bacterium]
MTNLSPGHSIPGPSKRGVRIVGTGSALPSTVVTNQDLEKVMDTSDEWIVQRTGISTRYRVNREKGESTAQLAADALKVALDRAKLVPSDLDLIICATMTPEMACPASACLVADRLKAGRAGAFDLNAACSGFVFSMNVAHDLIRMGGYRTIGVVGSDCLSTLMDYSTAGRSTAIIFGDAAGAAIVRATDDPSFGILAQSMHAAGEGWKEIYVPECPQDFPAGAACDPGKYGHVQMNGAGVFKFAVGTFPKLIEQTLEQANLKPEDIDMFVCHQSNARILGAARERFGLPDHKLYVNIDRLGNTVAASVPLCLDELVRADRITLGSGQRVMMVAFGGGLTWGASLWRV